MSEPREFDEDIGGTFALDASEAQRLAAAEEAEDEEG